MLPRWFNKWNSDNPTNIYGPAILVGAAGGAVVVVALLVSFGQPWVTKSQQTGPRGTGMHVPEFVVDIEAPDPEAEGFEVADVVDVASFRAAEAEPTEEEVEAATEEVATEGNVNDTASEEVATEAAGEETASEEVATDDAAAPAEDDTETAENTTEPASEGEEMAVTEGDDTSDGAGEAMASEGEEAADGEEMAADAEASDSAPGYSNDVIAEAARLLGDPSDEDYGRLLAAMRQWTGIPDLLDDPSSYQSAVALRMIQMTQNINANWSDHVAVNGEGGGVTCYSCHRGNPVPNGVWFKSTPAVHAMEGWSAVQNRVTPVSQFSSLPSDALEAYFLNYEPIGVHDLDARVEGVPGQNGYPGIQHAERTYSLMNYFANSLGVNCTFCHNTRAFYDGAQVTPQWGTAQLGIALVQELNEEYILPLEGVFPPERLGEAHGDVAKLACQTCHQGQQRPLKGLRMLEEYPELAQEAEE